jgi:uncharacterized protein YndB with AHSA1/START domain
MGSGLTLVTTSPDRITIVANFPNLKPSQLFGYWTNPELLRKWWPPVAELAAQNDGVYHFSWPKQDWHLRGRYTIFDKGKKLGFTWKWDHERIDETRVTVIFEELEKTGTKLTLHHEGYSKDAGGKKIRDEHVEGWTFFLGRLQETTTNLA